jgi:uncharacterized membrane protein
MILSGRSHPLLPLFLTAPTISFIPAIVASVVTGAAFHDHGVLKTAVSEYCDDASAAYAKYG